MFAYPNFFALRFVKYPLKERKTLHKKYDKVASCPLFSSYLNEHFLLSVAFNIVKGGSLGKAKAIKENVCIISFKFVN